MHGGGDNTNVRMPYKGPTWQTCTQTQPWDVVHAADVIKLAWAAHLCSASTSGVFSMSALQAQHDEHVLHRNGKCNDIAINV